MVKKYLVTIVVLLALFGFLPAGAQKNATQTIAWQLRDTTSVGGFKPVVLGRPAIVREKKTKALSFDGVDDGLIMNNNPITERKTFTIEMFIKPASDGKPAPRFFHCQDSAGNRCTIELRITPQKQWYLDTFLKNGKTNKSLALNDSTLLHPCDQWYWVALTYDGKTMTHYVNKVKEKEGDVEILPMNGGQISLGVRLNRVDWFKGLISEVRFHPDAIKQKALQQ